MAQRPRILVVDDDELLQELVKISLEGEGYVVAQALDAAGMRRELALELPDLIVLDVVLPDADGRKLLAGLKKEPRTAHIPVMLWSARYRDSDSDIALDLGAEEFFEKGPTDELAGKIERILLRISERMPVAR
jgi:two-component system alkaline phosphatase synthesis response regulator PhoP